MSTQATALLMVQTVEEIISNPTAARQEAYARLAELRRESNDGGDAIHLFRKLAARMLRSDSPYTRRQRELIVSLTNLSN